VFLGTVIGKRFFLKLVMLVKDFIVTQMKSNVLQIQVKFVTFNCQQKNNFTSLGPCNPGSGGGGGDALFVCTSTGIL
jgi:hypothetical protein